MKKFKFQFETVEKLRKIRQDEAMLALAQAQKKHQEAIEYKNSLLGEIENSWNRRQSFTDKAQSILEFKMEGDYLDGLKHRVMQAENSITRQKKSVDRAMMSYLTTRKQSKAIETLRENAVKDYRAEYNQFQQKQADDLNQMRLRLKKGAV